MYGVKFNCKFNLTFLDNVSIVFCFFEYWGAGGEVTDAVGELSLLRRCMREPCLDAPPPPPGRRATTAATMALAPTTALDCPAAAGCTWMERVSMGLVGHEELLVCSSGFSMAEAAWSTTLTV